MKALLYIFRFFKFISQVPQVLDFPYFYFASLVSIFGSQVPDYWAGWGRPSPDQTSVDMRGLIRNLTGPRSTAVGGPWRITKAGTLHFSVLLCLLANQARTLEGLRLEGPLSHHPPQCPIPRHSVRFSRVSLHYGENRRGAVRQGKLCTCVT